MKKVLLAAVVLVLGTSMVSAQKATPWFLGGNVASLYRQFDDSKLAAMSFAPQFGYMFNDNWGVALDLDVELGKNAGGVSQTLGLGGGLSLLYNMKITDKFFYTPSLRLGYGMTTYKDKDGKEVSPKYTVMGANLNFLAFEFRPSCRWALTFAFGGVNFTDSKVDGAKKSVQLLNAGLGNTAAGFKFYF